MKNKKRTSDPGESSVKNSPKKSPKKRQSSAQISASESESDYQRPATQGVRNNSISDGVSANEHNNLEEENDIELNQEVPVKSILNVEDITVDDEVYTLQCAEQIDLSNKNLDFTQSKTFITSKNQMFQAELLNSDKSFITLAVPKVASGSSLIKLPLKGHIVIHRVIDVPDSQTVVEDSYSKHTVVFPSDIKFRHPLLGTDWKAHVDLANAAFKRDSSFRKKSKKNREEEIIDDIVEIKKIKKEKIIDGNNVEIKRIKKEKILDDDIVEIAKLKRENSEPDIVTHKKKRRKKDL